MEASVVVVADVCDPRSYLRLSDVRKERALQTDLDASASQLEGWSASEQSSPSQKMERHERALQLAEALAQLPDVQRDATVLFHRGLKNLRKSLSEWNES